MILKRVLFFAFTFGLLFLQACADNPKLKDYPTADIDRPYTVPKGMSRLSLGAVFPFDILGSYEIGLAEHFSFTLEGIAPGLKFAFIDNPDFYFGASGNYLFFEGGAQIDVAVKIANFSRLYISGSYYDMNIFLAKTETSTIELFWAFQIAPNFAIGPALSYSRIRVGSDFANDLYFDVTGVVSDEYFVFHQFSQSVRAIWNLSPRIDLTGSMGYTRIFGDFDQQAGGLTGSLGVNLYF